uniref:Putative early protein E6 n=1 Tax=Tadarida brasiliensis papillomavirus TaxID=2507922 RepID=A0A411EZW2_9PAPI|nr:putative early protein E6 [Tadarida brasiliensis papillomavirus]
MRANSHLQELIRPQKVGNMGIKSQKGKILPACLSPAHLLGTLSGLYVLEAGGVYMLTYTKGIWEGEQNLGHICGGQTFI